MLVLSGCLRQVLLYTHFLSFQSLESQHTPSQMINKNVPMSPVSEISAEIPQRKHSSSLSSLSSSISTALADKSPSSISYSQPHSSSPSSSSSSIVPSHSSSSSSIVPSHSLSSSTLASSSSTTKNSPPLGIFTCSSSVKVDKVPPVTNSKCAENVKYTILKRDRTEDNKSVDSGKPHRTPGVSSIRQDIRQRILQSSRTGSQFGSRSDSLPKS